MTPDIDEVPIIAYKQSERRFAMGAVQECTSTSPGYIRAEGGVIFLGEMRGPDYCFERTDAWQSKVDALIVERQKQEARMRHVVVEVDFSGYPVYPPPPVNLHSE